jgi:hypothetical protein
MEVKYFTLPRVKRGPWVMGVSFQRNLAQKHGAKVNPRFLEDLKKISPEPKKELYPQS